MHTHGRCQQCVVFAMPGCSLPLFLLPQAVHMELSKPRPSIKLLYVTPEQLVKGERLKRELG